MPDTTHDTTPDTPRPAAAPLSALPSPLSRALAFASVIAGGSAGALIGYALIDAQSGRLGDVALGLGTLVGGTVFAAGTAVIAVLALRAIGEWRDIDDRSASR